MIIIAISSRGHLRSPKVEKSGEWQISIFIKTSQILCQIEYLHVSFSENLVSNVLKDSVKFNADMKSLT